MTQHNLTLFIELFLIQFITILTHELGHYIALRKYKVEVEEMRIFTKPIAWYFAVKNTCFSFGYLPLGGFVKYNEIAFFKLKREHKVKILTSGILANAFLMLFSIVLYIITGVLFFKLLVFVNAAKVISNAIPFGKTDAAKIFDIYKQKPF